MVRNPPKLPMVALLVTQESSARVMDRQPLVLSVSKDTIVKLNSRISSHSHVPLVADARMVFRLLAHQAIISQTRFNQLVRHVPTVTSAMEVV